jgi:hypothetical protein
MQFSAILLKVYSIPVYFSQTKVLIDVGVHSELGKAIRCDIKSGSVETSSDD